ncbi:MAG: hypothetical protein AAGB19_01460, partial [Cyanobacteria bacterium P01_F01_bin.3]
MWHLQRLSMQPVVFLISLTLVSLPSIMLSGLPAAAQTDSPAPTARYAQGEDVDLAEIVAEWRGYYDDVPVYQCVCIDDTCDQTAQWPYREFDRYQLSLALGPNNAQVTEAAGFNCFDIADGSRPSNPREFSAALRGTAEADDSSETTSTTTPTDDSSASPTVSAPVRRPIPTPPAPQFA